MQETDALAEDRQGPGWCHPGTGLLAPGSLETAFSSDLPASRPSTRPLQAAGGRGYTRGFTCPGVSPGRRFTVPPSVQAHVVGTRHSPPWGLLPCNEPNHLTHAPGQGDQLLKPTGFFDPGGGLGLSSNWPFKHPSLSPRRVHRWGGAGRGPAGNAGFRGHSPPPPVLLSCCPTAQTHLSGPQKPPQAKCSLRYYVPGWTLPS